MFCGWPLIHIRIGGSFANPAAVKAWIAVGDRAVGGLFAFGGLAMAPVAIGGISLGLVSFGGLAAGLISFGGFSLGAFAVGGPAIGGGALRGCAGAWEAAGGGGGLVWGFAPGAPGYGAHPAHE